MKVLVFIPTYNEEENIGLLIDKIQELDLNNDFLIVDDESTDNTLNIIKKKHKNYQNINLIVRKGERGRGLAGKAAFKYFSNSKYDILVEMDADLSHNPLYIPKFLKFLPKYDVIIGSRLIENGKEEGRSIYRKAITILSNLLVRILFRTEIKDCTSGFRAFKKNIVQKFNVDSFFSREFSITEEILYACLLLDSRVKEVPITFYDRSGGVSKLSFKRMFITFLGIFKILLRGKQIIKNDNLSIE